VIGRKAMAAAPDHAPGGDERRDRPDARDRRTSRRQRPGDRRTARLTTSVWMKRVSAGAVDSSRPARALRSLGSTARFPGKMDAAAQGRRQAGLELAAVTWARHFAAQIQRRTSGRSARSSSLSSRSRAREAPHAAHSRRKPRYRARAPRRNSAQPRAEASAIRTSCLLAPNYASPTGASIPAATCVAPAPGVSRSNTRTRMPALGGAPGAGEADRPTRRR